VIRRIATVCAGGVAAVAVVAATQFHAQAAAPQAAKTYNMYVTLYGALDNDPPGSADIAYPTLHDEAGGTGTYSDPITFATDKSELKPGTKVYYSYLKKYFIMEDDCAECDSDWGHKYRHIDMWAGNSNDSRILACEDSLTQDGQVPVIVNPASNLTVSKTPIFDPKTKKCYKP
jgi:hypothetical protein